MSAHHGRTSSGDPTGSLIYAVACLVLSVLVVAGPVPVVRATGAA